MKRKDWVYPISGAILEACMAIAGYKVHVEGDFPKGPYVYLPKHQRMLDIMLEGLIQYKKGRLGCFVRRPFFFPFNQIMDAHGSITLLRPKDIRKGKGTVEQAEKLRAETAKEAVEHLRKGEYVVIHPEGKRSPGEMAPIRMRNNYVLEYIVVEGQKQIGQIPFCPGGFEYRKKEAVIRIGQPFYTDKPSELEEHLKKEIPRLSGLSNTDNS